MAQIVGVMRGYALSQRVPLGIANGHRIADQNDESQIREFLLQPSGDIISRYIVMNEGGAIFGNYFLGNSKHDFGRSANFVV